MKYCNCCNKTKDKSEFNKAVSKKDGLQTYCKECSRERHRLDYINKPNRKISVEKSRKKHYSDSRRLIDRYKRICGCHFCKENEPVCLDFHHLNPNEKENEVSVLAGYSKSRLKLEIKKCIVVCSNCHRKLHAGILSVHSSMEE